MTDKPEKRGGLRTPPGGRPTLLESERKVKLSITLDHATVARLRARRTRPNEPLSQVIERLLHTVLPHMEWRKTSEQSPTVSDRYLVWDGDEVEIAWFAAAAQQWQMAAYNDYSYLPLHYFLYWMPLPPPPTPAP